MSAAQVLYYEESTTYRPEILRAAGYAVTECRSDSEMVQWFRKGGKADVVCISEGYERPCEAPLAITKSYCDAPIVLFRAGNHSYLQHTWTLEVQPLAPPRAWLDDISRLLAQTRQTVPESAELRVKSRMLRAQARQVREQTAKLKEDIQRKL